MARLPPVSGLTGETLRGALGQGGGIENVKMEALAGRTSAETISLYPPGIAIVTKDRTISADDVHALVAAR